MRITGGQWRSRRLKGPGRGSRLRPTPDFLRERAFAVLGDRTEGAAVLDLFAGTGAVGLEALSRGASRVVFVERHRAAVRLLEANRDTLCDSPGRTRVMHRPAREAVDELARIGERFQLAWADPPFESWTDGLDALVAAFVTGVLEPTATACLECPERADVLAAIPRWLEVERDLAGGASRVVLLARRELDVVVPTGRRR
jgi:16S rRNA (guanine966-N2)-methyltransferase